MRVCTDRSNTATARAELGGDASTTVPQATDDTGVGPAPPETVALWVKLVGSMGPDELDDFERRTFATWDRASLGDLRQAIQRRRKELAG